MVRRSPVLIAVCFWLIAGSSCGPPIDLSTALKLLPSLTGYYDNGLNTAGENHYLPSITFQLKNEGDVPLTSVDLSVLFWQKAEAGEKEIDSKYIRGLGSEALAPGATTEPITVRASVGYTSPYAGMEIFSHSQFKDMVVRLYAKKQGKTTKLGEVSIEHRVLPSVPSGVPSGGSHP